MNVLLNNLWLEEFWSVIVLKGCESPKIQWSESRHWLKLCSLVWTNLLGYITNDLLVHELDSLADFTILHFILKLELKGHGRMPRYHVGTPLWPLHWRSITRAITHFHIRKDIETNINSNRYLYMYNGCLHAKKKLKSFGKLCS